MVKRAGAIVVGLGIGALLGLVLVAFGLPQWTVFVTAAGGAAIPLFAGAPGK